MFCKLNDVSIPLKSYVICVSSSKRSESARKAKNNENLFLYLYNIFYSVPIGVPGATSGSVITSDQAHVTIWRSDYDADICCGRIRPLQTREIRGSQDCI